MTYKCVSCGDIILIVLNDDHLDLDELAKKAASHGKEHDDLEAMLED